jgi:hypothetical protein
LAGTFVQITTASAEQAASGTNQRTVGACHHLGGGSGAAVFAIAASIA